MWGAVTVVPFLEQAPGTRLYTATIPAEAVAKIPEVVELLTRREAKVIEAAKASDFDVEKLKAAMGAAREIH